LLHPQLGFQATAAEVRQFGVTTRKVVLEQANLSDSRSFVEVVRGGTMSHDSGRH
jgi:hypothetical protein